MQSLALRILLMLSLVLWTPAWCCCAVRAAAAMAEDAESVTTFACCSRTPAAKTSSAVNGTPSCCAGETSERAVSGYPDAEGEETRASFECCDDEHSCTCHDRPSELERLDTSSKIPSLKPQRDLSTPGIVAFDTSKATFPRATANRTILIRGGPVPRTRTLVDQHVLLLL